MLPPPTWTTLRRLEQHATLPATLDWAGMTPIVRIEPILINDGSSRLLDLARRSHVPGDSGLGCPGGDPVPAGGGPRMVANATLIARVTELVALFNRKSLDLPEGLFDRQRNFS